MENFDRCVRAVLSEEGGLSDHPQDPGGLTKYGISRRAYPDLDIRRLTMDDAIDLYRRDYWNPVHGTDLPASLALLVFDSAVNQGVGTAVRLLQKAVGVKEDEVGIGVCCGCTPSRWVTACFRSYWHRLGAIPTSCNRTIHRSGYTPLAQFRLP